MTFCVPESGPDVHERGSPVGDGLAWIGNNVRGALLPASTENLVQKSRSGCP